MKKKKDKEKYNFDFEINSNIKVSDIYSGRVPILGKDLEPEFTSYQPDIYEAIKNAYEGLFRIWEKQGKDPIQELKKLKGGE